MKKFIAGITIFLVFMLLCGCEPSEDDFEYVLDTDEGEDITVSSDEDEGIVTRTVAVFGLNEAGGLELPIPNDLLYSGTLDATLNIPFADPENRTPEDARHHINALDGWSTTAPFIFTFKNTYDPSKIPSEEIIGVDANSLKAGNSVRIFEVIIDTSVDPVGGPVTDVVRELDNEEFSVGMAPEDNTGRTIRVFPNIPFKSATSYMVVMTDNLKDTRGRGIIRDIVYDIVRDSEPLDEDDPLREVQIRVNAMEDAAQSRGIDKEDIVVSSTFTTQSVGTVLTFIKTTLMLNLPEVTATVAPLIPSPFGGPTQFYSGSMTIPYYHDASNGASDDDTPLTGLWEAENEVEGEKNLTRFNPLPQVKGFETIPVLLSIPTATQKPDDGWPIAIFVHELTRSRVDLFALADSLSAAGIAAIAIDMPLHGFEDTTSGLFGLVHIPNTTPGELRERTFGLDLIDNATEEDGADGQRDPSGEHMLGLSSPLTVRDNFRQAIVDLFSVAEAIKTLDIDGDESADFDTGNVTLVGHGIGAFVGASFIAIQNATDPELQIQAASLAMPSGALIKMLDGSETGRVDLVEELAEADIQEGTSEYESALWLFQTVVDSADAINYLATSPTFNLLNVPLHVIEVVGPPKDDVTPTTVNDAPLAGTEPFAKILGLSKITATIETGNAIRGIVRFITSDDTIPDHTSLLIKPTQFPPGADVIEMQNQVASFLNPASPGRQITINNPALVQQ